MANPVSVHDVAAYILKKIGKMTAMKLQKLVYYAQGWHLVWEDAPLFKERIEAWANGPVAPALYEGHRGKFEVRAWPKGNAKNLSKGQRDSIDSVLSFYGDKTSQWLSELTHMEPPWREARAGLGPGERGNREITHAAMAEYYGSL